MKYQPLVSLAFALPAAVSATPFVAGRDVCKPMTVTKTITVDSWDATPTGVKEAGLPSDKPAIMSAKPGYGAPPVDIKKWVEPSYGCGNDGKRLCPPKDCPVSVYACGHDGAQKCVIEKWVVIVYTCGSDGKQLCAPPDWTRPEYTCGHDGKQLCLPEPHPQCGHGYPGPCCQPPPSSCGYNGQPCSSEQPTRSTSSVESTSTVVITSTSTLPGTSSTVSQSSSTFPTSTAPFGNSTMSSVSGSSTSSSGSVSETTSSSSVSGTITSTSTSSTVSSTSSTSSSASPTSTCGIVGYDKGITPAYWYDASGTYGTLAACSSACATNGCVSFGVGNNTCLLYNVTVTQNVNPTAGSPYTFYESTCVTSSTSSGSVSATATSSSSSSSIVDSTSASVTQTQTSSSSGTSTPTSSSATQTSTSSSSGTSTTASTSASVTPTPTPSPTDTSTSSTPTSPTSTSECIPSATPVDSAPAGAKCGVKGGQGAPDIITTITANSLGECAEQCFYTWDKPCLSVGYDPLSTLCELYATPVGTVNPQYASFDNYDKACFAKKDCPGSTVMRRKVQKVQILA